MFRIVARQLSSGDVFVGHPCESFSIQVQDFLLNNSPNSDTFRHGNIAVQVFPGGGSGPWFNTFTWVQAEIIMTKGRAITTEQWARPNLVEWAAISTNELDLVVNTNKEFEAIRFLTNGQPILAEIKGGADQRTWASFGMGRLTVKARICLQGPIPPNLFPPSVRELFPTARSPAAILTYLVREDKLIRTGRKAHSNLQAVIDQSAGPDQPTRRIYQDSRPALVRVDTSAPDPSKISHNGSNGSNGSKQADFIRAGPNGSKQEDFAPSSSSAAQDSRYWDYAQAGPSGINTQAGSNGTSTKNGSSGFSGKTRPGTPTMDELPQDASAATMVDSVRLENEGGSSHRVRRDTPHPSAGMRLTGLYTRHYGRDLENLRVVVPEEDPAVHCGKADSAVVGIIRSHTATAPQQGQDSGQQQYAASADPGQYVGAQPQQQQYIAPADHAQHSGTQSLASHGNVTVTLARQNYGYQQVNTYTTAPPGSYAVPPPGYSAPPPVDYAAPPVDYRQQDGHQQDEQELYNNLPPPVPAVSGNPYKPHCPRQAQANFRALFANATAASRPGKPPSTLVTLSTPKRKKAVKNKKVRFDPPATSSPKKKDEQDTVVVDPFIPEMQWGIKVKQTARKSTGGKPTRRTSNAEPSSAEIPAKKSRPDPRAETDSDDSDRT